MVVLVEPVVEMNLIQVRGYDFFTQFVRFGAWERHLQPSQHRKEGLGNPVGADAGTGIGGRGDRKGVLRILTPMARTARSNSSE